MPSVNRTVEILSVYGKEEAYSVIRAGVADYQNLINQE
jgi:hypothetical protein